MATANRRSRGRSAVEAAAAVWERSNGPVTQDSLERAIAAIVPQRVAKEPWTRRVLQAIARAGGAQTFEAATVEQRCYWRHDPAYDHSRHIRQ